jgi:type VI secretion system protein ImpH
MGGQDREPVTDLAQLLEKKLLSKSRSFSFFQTLRLLGNYTRSNGSEKSHYNNTGLTRKNGNSSSPLKIRVQPNLSLAFPSSDVDRVEKKNGHYQVTANLLGLYGTCSPLPTFYTEDFFQDVDEGNFAAKDLTDAISDRLYKLLFEGWSKYKSMLKVMEENDQGHHDRIFSLLGFGSETLRNTLDDPLETLRYSGLFAMKTRSAAGLETLLKDSFPNTDISIEQCVERHGIIPEDQRSVLGGGTGGNNGICLGVQSHLGGSYKDRSGAFRIKLASLSEQDYRDFFPGMDKYNKIVSLTGLYINDPLIYDIEVSMDESVETSPLCLGGEKWSSLGLDTWLSSGGKNVENTMRFYPN